MRNAMSTCAHCGIVRVHITLFFQCEWEIKLPKLVAVLDLITPRYLTRGTEFLRIDFHRTNYGIHEPMFSAMRQFNVVIGLFDFGLSRDQFMNRLRLTTKSTKTYPTLHRFSESIVPLTPCPFTILMMMAWLIEMIID
jgi:hypothetical protein